MSKLTREEKALEEEVEAGEWKSVGQKSREQKRYQTYAESTFKKDRRVNIRISGRDLLAIQKRAIEEGIPYQTLIASLLHKFVTGTLVERKSSSH